MKQTLRATIIARLMPTPATRLRGVPRVNLDHGDPLRLRLVLYKAVELRKAPPVQPSFVLGLLVRASAHLGGLSDSGEVFQHDGTARGGVLDDAFREDVIVIFAAPKLLARQLAQVSLSASGAFGLQLSTEAEGAAVLLFPPLLAEELASAGDGGTVESQVHTDDLRGWLDSGFRDGDNEMEGKTPLAVTQVCATGLVSGVLLEVLRDNERQFDTPCTRGKASRVGLPLDPGRTGIIADTGQCALRTAYRLERRRLFALLLRLRYPSGIRLLLLAFPGERTLHSLRRFDAGSAHQLRRQVGILSTQGIVRPFVQLHPVATCARKPFTGYFVEARGMLLKRRLEYLCLLWRRIQVKDKCSLHTERISYIPCFVN